MTAMPDHHGDIDDDTADLGPPIHGYDDNDDRNDEVESTRRGRLRPSSTVRRVHGAIVGVCYMVALGSAAWLLVEAALHQAVLIGLFSTGLLVWLLPGVPRLVGWVRAVQDTGQTLPVSWQAQLVCGLLTALNLFLFGYAHL